jgi:hypothetical protein
MKITLTFFTAALITLLSFTARAQDDEPVYAKSYMSIMGGASFPRGLFASTDYTNNESGYAHRGSAYALEGAYYFYKNLGIGLNFSYNDNGELNTNDVQNIANGYNTALIKDQTEVTSVNRYHYFALMAGPQYSFLYKKFTLDLRVQAGILKSASTPEITVIFDNSPLAVNTMTQNSSKSSDAAIGALAGLRYSLGNSWDIGIRATYIKASGIAITNGNNIGETGRFVTTQPISALQTTLGITLKF